MAAETINQHGKSFILVVPHVSVYDPGMSDSLISAGRLTETGYNANSRIPRPTMLLRMALPRLPFSFAGVELLLQTIIPSLSWSTQDTHSDCLSPSIFKGSTCDYTLTCGLRRR